MAINTYDNLKTSVDSWLDRDDLTAQVDDFIALAEARHKREVRIREMIMRCPIGITNRFIDLPNDFLVGRTIRITSSPIGFLTSINSTHMDRIRREEEGRPDYFTIHSQIEFDRQPDQTYTGELVYYKSLRGLSDSNSTNALLTRAPDIYLYAVLSASAPWLVDDERIPVWENLYKTARDAINLLDQRGIGVPVATVPGLNP